MFLLNTQFESLEGKRHLNSGTALIEFRVLAGERIDQSLPRFEIAGYEYETAGVNTPDFQILAVMCPWFWDWGRRVHRNYYSHSTT
eukprot:102283-Pyramimonas_sp.AAC.2